MAAKRILVVDDEWKIRQIVVHLLKQAGYETHDTGESLDAATLRDDRVVGDIGDGSTPLRLRTSNGSITIR